MASQGQTIAEQLAVSAELGTGPVPVEPYISADYYEKERETIFRRTWLNVGRVQEVPEPGSFFIRDLAAAKASIIVVRGQDGEIRAFHNVCSHRGNRMANQPSGHCRHFTCGFHGWIYGLDGTLRNVPDEACFHGLDKAGLGLTPVAVGQWEGFVFINMQHQPQTSLDEFLGSFGADLKGWPFANAGMAYGYKVKANCNWKVAMNFFQESYHVPFVHKDSVPDSSAGPGNPFSQPVGMRLHPLHSIISIYRNPEPRLNEIDRLVGRHGPGYRSRSTTLTAMPPGVNPAKSDKWGFDINTIFPNFVMNLWGSGMYLTFQFWPVTANTCVIEARVYSPPPRTAGEKFGREYNRMVLRSAISEDVIVMEQIQPMLESGAKTHFVLQEGEAVIRHHCATIDRFVRAGGLH